MLRRGSIALLSLCSLMACTSAPPLVSPSASPSAGSPASTTPSASGDVGATASATATPSSGATGTATPTIAPSATTATGILKGQVYQASAQFAPDGTTVTVTSLDANHPYTANVQTASGAYVVNGVPQDVQVQVTATRPGWTSRSRVLVLRAFDPQFPNRNVYNFGGPSSTDDPAGPAFYLSDYPEIQSVEPVDQDTSRPNDTMTFKLVVSEPLDVTNQRRLASAFLLIPNNQEAEGPNEALPDANATSAQLSGLRVGANPLVTPAYRYRQNSGFMNGLAVSSFKWDADGRTATFSLNAPVKTGSEKEGEYAFLLVSQDDKSISDGTNALGMDANGNWGGYSKGGIIYSAVKKAGLVLNDAIVGKDSDRWVQTHQSWTSFSVARDTVAPKVSSVTARRNYVDNSSQAFDRLEITFSKPMVAFPNEQSAALLSLNNYAFAAAATEDALASRNVNSVNAQSISPAATIDDIRTAFDSTAGAYVNTDSASLGNFSIKLSVNDPKTVILSMPAGAIPLDSNFIKVYVGTDSDATSTAASIGKVVADPAGNNIDTTANTAVGPIY